MEFKNDTLTEIVLRTSPFPKEVIPIRYIAGIAYHLINKYYSRRSKHPTVSRASNELFEWGVMDPSFSIFETDDYINFCISKLSPKDQTLMENIIQDKTVEEIMELMNYRNKATFYSRKYQVLLKFRKFLKKFVILF